MYEKIKVANDVGEETLLEAPLQVLRIYMQLKGLSAETPIKSEELVEEMMPQTREQLEYMAKGIVGAESDQSLDNNARAALLRDKLSSRTREWIEMLLTSGYLYEKEKGSNEYFLTSVGYDKLSKMPIPQA